MKIRLEYFPEDDPVGQSGAGIGKERSIKLRNLLPFARANLIIEKEGERSAIAIPVGEWIFALTEAIQSGLGDEAKEYRKWMFMDASEFIMRRAGQKYVLLEPGAQSPSALYVNDLELFELHSFLASEWVVAAKIIFGENVTLEDIDVLVV